MTIEFFGSEATSSEAYERAGSAPSVPMMVMILAIDSSSMAPVSISPIV